MSKNIFACLFIKTFRMRSEHLRRIDGKRAIDENGDLWKHAVVAEPEQDVQKFLRLPNAKGGHNNLPSTIERSLHHLKKRLLHPGDRIVDSSAVRAFLDQDIDIINVFGILQ